jgi:hypothetical protein
MNIISEVPISEFVVFPHHSVLNINVSNVD